ncbi:hypothetical protein CDEST_04536 [Colletotrichum destructivum]|uniref:Uncharacterized protein n=1 Tax=Colletotrichum destructivum TaxID=34406 RepID=A0AAX4I814_9PEZI|nr:hypothetical protein CDEST_04536 [Colletotrichum destructivum]
MVSFKILALTVMASSVSAQQLFSCWCGPNQGTTRTACDALHDSAWMESGRCIVMESAARDYFINTACSYGPGSEWCDTR